MHRIIIIMKYWMNLIASDTEQILFRTRGNTKQVQRQNVLPDELPDHV